MEGPGSLHDGLLEKPQASPFRRGLFKWFCTVHVSGQRPSRTVTVNYRCLFPARPLLKGFLCVLTVFYISLNKTLFSISKSWNLGIPCCMCRALLLASLGPGTRQPAWAQASLPLHSQCVHCSGCRSCACCMHTLLAPFSWLCIDAQLLGSSPESTLHHPYMLKSIACWCTLARPCAYVYVILFAQGFRVTNSLRHNGPILVSLGCARLSSPC